MRSVRVSVPGKLILIGEHAVVYGRPALAAAIDRRLFVTLRPTGSGGVSLTLPGIAHAEQTSWDAIAEHAERSLSAWARFDGEPNADFAAVRGTEAAHLVKVALGAALSRSGLSPRELPGATIDVTSDLPVGSGFGSSAAAAVGVLAAFEAAMGSASAGREALLAAALDVERCQHGRPSGIDTETVVRGGLVWAERTAERPERLTFSNLLILPPLLSAIAVYDTGRPRETTGEVVAAVRRFRDRDPSRFDETLDRFERATRAFRAAIESSEGEVRQLIDSVREGQACLEAMGAVPEAMAQRVRAIEAAGGAAKISGAGAASGDAAGSLLVVAPEVGDTGATTGALEGYARREVALGAHGLLIEES
ncbi:MAG TPA: hypothetical protein VGS22_00535 [Thermoanaerobaculia bacterium]|jgi:mevalonate kinase|nr:hypothetical protein [Thermoanaerobaculia bacterium]